MAAGARPSVGTERRRDKLSLRIRKEGKVVSDSHQVLAHVESHEVPVVPATSRSHDQSYAQSSDNRHIVRTSPSCVKKPVPEMTWISFPDWQNDSVAVSSQESMMPHRNNKLKWTAFPKVCQKCIAGIKRKQIGSEGVRSKSHCDSGQERLPFKLVLVDTNAECSTRRKDHISSDTFSANASSPLTADMSVYANCSLGRTVLNNDAGKSASITSTVRPSITTPSSSSKSSNMSCGLLSVNLQHNVPDSMNNVLQSSFVQPPFMNSAFQIDSQLNQVDSRSVGVTAAADLNRDTDLHQCPLCDMIFDSQCVREEREAHISTCIGDTDGDDMLSSW